tara:strand:- start:125 stop:1174 length:1050 start_codon:yes stop_codon:yes gene_type:complete
MFKTIKKGFLPFLVGFSALSVSGSAAFYSVFGLSKLFAGASTEVIIMAGSLEVAKLVTASLLYQYWDEINKILKYYLTLAVVILILITSMGIYGFLSSAYQETFNELTYVENEKKFLNQKIEFYQQDVTRYEKELQQTLDNITSLSEARSVSIQVKDTSVAGGVRNTISTVDLRAAQDRLRIEENKRQDVNLKRDIAVDSLRTYQRQVLELDNNADVAGELGPLKYIAGLTGYPMDKIINVLLLIIIFVFDPLAVSLVVAANFAYNQAFPKKKFRENLYEEQVEVKENIEIKEEKPNTFDKYSREEKENIIEKGIQEAIKGKAGATPANFNRITARKILDNLDNNTKIY